jgi:putative phosphoesterase
VKLGIISDSHGRSKRLALAADLLAERGAEILVHCGDILSPEDVAILGRWAECAYLVAGNMDRHITGPLEQAAKERKVAFAADFLTVDLGDGRHLAVTHGHLDNLLEELIRGGQYAYVCHGHTHERRDARYGSTRVLNPGSLYHPKGHRRTVLLLDVDTDQVEEVDVPK